jgi:branched-chain amino acid transport system substrate-binding protein
MIVATSCSSSKLSSSTSGGTGKTYTIGLLTDVTGPGSVTGASTPKGVAAGIGLASQEGYKIKYVVADTGSSPSGALTAAQTLVEQDHVFAVIAISGLTFSASNYLTSQNIPVVGAAIDASEWITSKNMFSVIGTQNFTKV